MGSGPSVTIREDLNASVLKIKNIDKDIKALHLLTNATEDIGAVPKKDNVEGRVEIISDVFNVVTQVYGYAQAIYKLMERLLEALENIKRLLTNEIEALVQQMQENSTRPGGLGSPVQNSTKPGGVGSPVQNGTRPGSVGSIMHLSSTQENIETDERMMRHLLSLEKLKKQMVELEKLTITTEELLGKIRNSAGMTQAEREKLLDIVHELQRIENMTLTEKQYETEKREKEAEEKRRLENEERIRREETERERKKLQAEELAKKKKEEKRRNANLAKERDMERKQREAEKQMRKREEEERHRLEAEELEKKRKEDMRRNAELAKLREQERKQREAEEQLKKKEEMERQRLEEEEHMRIEEENERIRLAAEEEARIKDEEQQKIEEEMERQRLEEEHERKMREAEEEARIKADEERKRHEAEEEERIKQMEERMRLESLQREEEERIKRAAEEKAMKKEEKRKKREVEEQNRLREALERSKNEMQQEFTEKEEAERKLRDAEEERRLKGTLELAKHDYEWRLKQELLNKEEKERANREADEQKWKEKLELDRKDADELREKLAAMKEKLQQSAFDDFTDAGRFTDTTDFQYKSNYSDDEVDDNRDYLKYSKGFECVFSTMAGTLDHEDLVCSTKDEISDAATACITSIDATVISQEVSLQTTTPNNQQVSGRIFIPHRPVRAGSHVSVMGQVDGKRWKAYESVYPTPTSVDKDINWTGTEVSFVNSVRLVAIVKQEEQHVALDKYGKRVQSSVDHTINLSIPADAFKQPSQLNLGVSLIDKEELQMCKTYHSECEHVLGCSSLVQINLNRPPAKDFEVWIVAKANIDTKAHGRQYIVFLDDGRGWRQARSEWKEDSHRQVIMVPKGQPTYRVVGVRMAPDTGLKEAQMAVEALCRHSNEIHVSLVFRQGKSDRNQCMLVCVQSSEMDKNVKELTKLGYSLGGGESGVFCIEDQGVLLVTFSGNIGSPSGSGGKLRLQYLMDKAVAVEKIPLYVLDPSSQPETREYSGLMHVVKESQPNIPIMSTEIFLPKI